MIKTKECAMRKIVLSFVAFALLAAPSFIGAPVIGGSAQAEEIRIGVPDVRVEDRDHDRDRDRDRWRRDHDHDHEVIVIKKHHDHDND
jgi:Ni/Co efflux regulator RcnB